MDKTLNTFLEREALRVYAKSGFSPKQLFNALEKEKSQTKQLLADLETMYNLFLKADSTIQEIHDIYNKVGKDDKKGLYKAINPPTLTTG